MWFVAHLERLSCRPTELDGLRWTSVTYSNESVGAGEKGRVLPPGTDSANQYRYDFFSASLADNPSAE